MVRSAEGASAAGAIDGSKKTGMHSRAVENGATADRNHWVDFAAVTIRPRKQVSGRPQHSILALHRSGLLCIGEQQVYRYTLETTTREQFVIINGLHATALAWAPTSSAYGKLVRIVPANEQRAPQLRSCPSLDPSLARFRCGIFVDTDIQGKSIVRGESSLSTNFSAVNSGRGRSAERQMMRLHEHVPVLVLLENERNRGAHC
jgi:hypothetical protein